MLRRPSFASPLGGARRHGGPDRGSVTGRGPHDDGPADERGPLAHPAALSYAYNDDDVLLLAGLGNDPGQPDGLVESPWVMGVGGVSDDINRTHDVNLQHWEIGGYSGGLTTAADCPASAHAFCGIGGYHTLRASLGGMSSATANVAAIATLIRAASPGLTNVQVRNRLRNTAYGRAYRLADAEWAIENVSPVGGTISGPTDITSEGTYSWQVTATGGLGDYTCSWHKRTGNGSWRGIGDTSQISPGLPRARPALNFARPWARMDACGG